MPLRAVPVANILAVTAMMLGLLGTQSDTSIAELSE